MDYNQGHLCKHVHKVSLITDIIVLCTYTCITQINILYKAQAAEDVSTLEEIDVKQDDPEVLSDDINGDLILYVTNLNLVFVDCMTCNEDDDHSAGEINISIRKTAGKVSITKHT